MANRIGRFVLRVSGDSSDLSRDLRKSTGDVEKYTKSWTRAANLISASIGAIAVTRLASGFVGVFQSASESINDLLNFSDVTQTAVADIQSIELAASRIGVDRNAVRDLIKDVNERISEAVTLDSGEAKDVLDILGLDSAELLAQSTFDRFVQLGRAIGNVKNEATQLQLVRQLSGSADEALRLLRNIEQINSARKFIDDFNIGFDISGIDAFRAAQSEIADISAVLAALRDQLVITVAPAVKEFLLLFKTDVVKNFIATLFAGLKNLDDFFGDLIDRGPEFSLFLESIQNDFRGFLSDIGDFGILQVDRIFDRLAKRVGVLNGFGLFDAVRRQFLKEQGLNEKEINNFLKEFERRKFEFKPKVRGEAFEGLSKLFAGIREDFGKLFSVEESKKNAKAAAQQFKKGFFDPISKALRDFAKQQIESLKTPLDILNEETQKLVLAREAGLINDQQGDLISKRIREDYEKALIAADKLKGASSGFSLLQRGTAAEFSFRLEGTDRLAKQQELQNRVLQAQNEALKNAEKSRKELRNALNRNTDELKKANALDGVNPANNVAQVIEVVPVQFVV